MKTPDEEYLAECDKADALHTDLNSAACDYDFGKIDEICEEHFDEEVRHHYRLLATETILRDIKTGGAVHPDCLSDAIDAVERAKDLSAP